MASAKIPDPLVRRHLIEKELAPAQALKVAEAYLAEGRSVEAVEFLQKAAATEQLTELRSEPSEPGTCSCSERSPWPWPTRRSAKSGSKSRRTPSPRETCCMRPRRGV